MCLRENNEYNNDNFELDYSERVELDQDLEEVEIMITALANYEATLSKSTLSWDIARLKKVTRLLEDLEATFSECESSQRGE